MKLLYRLICLLTALAATSLSPAHAQAPEARFAFVIGNDSYDGAPLKTAANDAGVDAECTRYAPVDETAPLTWR